MEYVGVGLRAVAAIIDTVLLMVVGYLIAMFSGGTTAAGFPSLTARRKALPARGSQPADLAPRIEAPVAPAEEV